MPEFAKRITCQRPSVKNEIRPGGAGAVLAVIPDSLKTAGSLQTLFAGLLRKE